MPRNNKHLNLSEALTASTLSMAGSETDHMKAVVAKIRPGRRHYDEGFRYLLTMKITKPKEGEAPETYSLIARDFRELGRCLGKSPERFREWAPLGEVKQEMPILPSYKPIGWVARVRAWLLSERTATV